MDDAWVSGGDKDSRLAKQLYTDRVDGVTGIDTKLVDVKSKQLVDVIKKLNTSSSFAKPLADVFLVSHGDDTGWLAIDLDKAGGKTVSYQVLREILDATDTAGKARRTALQLPSTLFKKADGSMADTRIVLAGCRVGNAPKFIDAFKQLLGGQVPVVASKFLHEFDMRARFAGTKLIAVLGMFEYLAYGFEANALTALSRDDLIDKLKKNPKNTWKDGTAIPQAQWETWLPKTRPLPRKFGRFRMPVSVQLGQKLAGVSALDPGELRFLQGTFPSFVRRNPDPPDKTVAGLKALLSADQRFQPAWGFPMHEQYGHATFDEFFNAFTWTLTMGFDRKLKVPKAVWTGTRFEWTLLVPVTGTVGGDDLIYNFFPPRGSTTDKPVIGINDADTQLFYKTP